MKLNSTTIAATGILWLGSVGAAWYFGTRHGGGTDFPGRTRTESPDDTSGGSRSGFPGRKGGILPGSAAEPGKFLTAKQIIAKVRAGMQGGNMQNPMAMMKSLALLDNIRFHDIPEALAEVEAMKEPQQKMMMLMALMGKWAETDGPAAMKYAEEHPAGPGMMAQVGKMGVVSAWAEKDPEAVWKWYKNQSADDPGSGGMMSGNNLALSSIFSQMAAKDPELAFKRLDEIEGSGRQMALAGMFQSAMFDDDKRSAILKAVDAMPDDSERKQAKQMMLGQWAMMAPDEAVEWMKSQPQSEQGTMRESVGSMLMMSDPKKGAALLLEDATEAQKPQRYAQVVGTWAMSDTNAAGTWLRDQPQGPQLDDARSSFVSAASIKDPESAMAWAGTITDEAKRVTATGTAYHAWITKDPAAAEKSLSASGLSAEQMEKVRTSPVPSPASFPFTAPAAPSPTEAPPSDTPK